MNAAIAAAGSSYNWSLVTGINTDFLTHGYPSTTPWIRTFGQSFEMQGTYSGTFHPNATGHLDIARHLLATYMANLGKGKLGRPRHRR